MLKNLKKIFRLKDHPDATHHWDAEKALEVFLDEVPLENIQDIIIVWRNNQGNPGITYSAMDGLAAIGLLDLGKDLVKESF